jgi:hypothetical protein
MSENTELVLREDNNQVRSRDTRYLEANFTYRGECV